MFIAFLRKFLSVAVSRLSFFNASQWGLLIVVFCAISFRIQPEFGKRAIAVLAACAAIVTLVRRLKQIRWPKRKPIIVKVVSFARNARTSFSTGWEVEMLHLCVLLLFFVLLIFYLFWPKSMQGMSWTMQAVGILFVAAGAIDAARVTMMMARFAWARWTGKMYYAGVAAFSIWAGDIFAQKAIAQATGLDPKHFEATARLIHWVATPLIAAAVSVSVLLLLSFIVYFLIMTVSMAQQPVQILRMSFGHLIPRKPKSSIAYRLVHGKNRMRGESTHVHFFDDAVRWMRPVSICLFCSVVLAGIGRLQSLPSSTVDPVVRALVVSIEFNANQKCGSKVVAEPLDHLEEGKAAIATRQGSEWRLDPAVCEVEKASPESEAP